jgi:O-antigen ligase
MMHKKAIGYLIAAMVILSVTVSWGAYAAVVIAFILGFSNNGRSVVASIIRQKQFIFLAAAIVLSTIFSRALSKSLLIDGIIILHFMAFAVLIMGIKLENLERLFRLLNFIAIFVCLYGIYQYLSGNLTINKSWADPKLFGSMVRIYSSMRNPNIFAGYLAFNISYASAYFLQKKKDVYIIANILLSSVCLILTYSRGGFIAMFAGMLVVMLLYREWKVSAYLIVMTICYYSYNMIGSLNRADLGIMSTDSSSLYRMEIWKASFKLFYNNIAFGSGLGSVLQYLSFSSAKLKGFIAHSHNIYIHLLAETGIAGLASFGFLMLTGFRKSIGFWREHRKSDYAYIAAGFAASVAALAVHGLVDAVIFIPTRSLIFLIYLSLFPILMHNLKKPVD